MRYMLAAGLAGALALTMSTTALAATITVNTVSDELTSGIGLCSLRKAINNANAESDTTAGDCVAGTRADTINFSVSGTIILTSTLPAIEHILKIDGTGQRITVDGANRYQVVAVKLGAALNLKSVTVANGYDSSSAGGGIQNQGRLSVTKTIFSGNNAPEGGGIENEGTLAVIESAFVGNSATVIGGGIDNRGRLTIATSIFSGNSAPEEGGGGIENYQGTLTITKSAFSRNASSSGQGGSIQNYQGTLTITKSAFSRNSAPNGGGGIDNFGSLTISNSTFLGNSATSAFGGGILNDDTLTITSSTFSGNSSNYGGGAIENYATLTITSSTFSGNSSAAGGGIENDANGTVTVINSTFFDNSSGYGGGIENHDGKVTITNGTFSGNSAYPGEGGNIQNYGVLASLRSTILAASSGGDCAGTITDAGYNIAEDTTCRFEAVGSHNRINPKLDRSGLRNNGGPTRTVALEFNSPAIDAIPVAECINQASPPKRITTDQRGFPRACQGTVACDIGAYESQQ